MRMTVTYHLRLKDKPSVLVDARSITPDSFAGKQLNGILSLRILEGGRQITLQDLFDVDGPSEAPKDPGEIAIVIDGSINKISFVGYKMSKGSITINGDAGHFIGYRMRGGSIVVHGNVRNYLGAKMRDGSIEVFGNAEHWIGAKLLGEKPGKGMKGGTIIIHGNAGSEIGSGMKSGTIIIDGDAGNSVGNHMVGGTIIIKGNCGLYPGLEMSSGRIVINGSVEALLPSFYVDSLIQPLKVKGITFNKSFMSFIGDALVGGHGLLQVSYEDNKELLEEFRKLLE
ncbi:formylmethanofuran dehydrogenase subunit C [Vulcanisaeta sp. JCM 14467]|uniref:formylmethanofuran dehydrogenase subunit C n=1 Tax=Vulcanisaeta sp. JCM 14467 TaxID=1295370 RepID=UPI000B16ACCC|nr:formylmethanofuran dehydrogenase subunit C [Vulcanisaeta sp. JCM 14467]